MSQDQHFKDYDGERNVEGLMHGKGTLSDEYANLYVGEFVEGKKHGHGIFTWSNGDVYEGQFLDGDICGMGTKKFYNGDVYEGEFRFACFHGHGKLVTTRTEMRDGSGRLMWPILSSYEGNFHCGKFWGQGVLTSLFNGDTHSGKWCEGKRNGEGVFNSGDGRQRIIGEWVDDEYQSEDYRAWDRDPYR